MFPGLSRARQVLEGPPRSPQHQEGTEPPGDLEPELGRGGSWRPGAADGCVNVQAPTQGPTPPRFSVCPEQASPLPPWSLSNSQVRFPSVSSQQSPRHLCPQRQPQASLPGSCPGRRRVPSSTTARMPSA